MFFEVCLLICFSCGRSQNWTVWCWNYRNSLLPQMRPKVEIHEFGNGNGVSASRNRAPPHHHVPSDHITPFLWSVMLPWKWNTGWRSGSCLSTTILAEVRPLDARNRTAKKTEISGRFLMERKEVKNCRWVETSRIKKIQIGWGRRRRGRALSSLHPASTTSGPAFPPSVVFLTHRYSRRPPTDTWVEISVVLKRQ
jgi:hypothetical protein